MRLLCRFLVVVSLFAMALVVVPGGPAAGAAPSPATFGPNDPRLSTDLAGHPIDTSSRLACSRQLTDDEAARLRDPSYVLGWDPRGAVQTLRER